MKFYGCAVNSIGQLRPSADPSSLKLRYIPVLEGQGFTALFDKFFEDGWDRLGSNSSTSKLQAKQGK